MLKSMKEYTFNKNYNIDFKGRVSQDELARLIRESWVNLHFSVTEGWGLSIMESSASGTPTVALKAPGVIDIIKDEYNGFVLDDICEFKDKILYIVNNKSLYKENSRNFAKDFTWEKTSQAWCMTIRNDENTTK